MTLKFLVDSMHGYVARWLRIMGYDTVYLKNIGDQEAVKMASEGRILVTSDSGLAKYAETKGITVVMVKGLNEHEILRTLIGRFGLSFKEDFLRCTICNGELRVIGSEEAFNILGFIPKGVEKFWKCSSCSKVYWKGSHWKNIYRQISSFFNNESADNAI
ncbi:MAG: Mut7-C RNAse domain-containing protein [Crenarchaeota archaeon]|nr:Mut7-C RNAse domain-containing protein [Thermoproteota archaeon]MDW8034305.1 Mut7-C RNAse domain-containing protein [Nitrososphaerota archaeon]